MGVTILEVPSHRLATEMRGMWWLLSREDYNKDGERRIDPILGANPIGIVAYGTNHFTAQFMKRDRNENTANPETYSANNNTIASGGYDAYFGTYEVNEETGKVKHTLIGSVTASNIGMTVTRDLWVSNNRLIIQLETTTPQGEPVTRSLTWERIG